VPQPRRDVRRFVLRDGLRSTGGRSGQRFWRLIVEGRSSEDAVIACGVSMRWGRDGSPWVAGCRRSVWTLRRVVTCRSPSERRSRCCGPRSVGARDSPPSRRAASTISPELRRHAATRGGRLDYRASVAQWQADPADPLDGLPPLLPVPTAAKVLGLSRSAAHRLRIDRCASGTTTRGQGLRRDGPPSRTGPERGRSRHGRLTTARTSKRTCFQRSDTDP
jgi:hypothetical protein